MKRTRTIAAISSLVALTGALMATGCVGGSSDVSKEDLEALKAYVLDKAPQNIPHKLDINYDNKVTLIGYRIEPEGTVHPNQKVKITMYWRCDKKVGDGWNLFTHVLDGSGERILNIDNVGPLRQMRDTHQALGPSAWTPGKVYVDEQTFTVPDKVRTDKIQVVTGIWKDNDRLKPVSGPHDRENRGIVATIPNAVVAKKPEAVNTRVPLLRVDKLEKGVKIKIDGKLDDDAWKTAPMAGPFVDVKTGQPNKTFPVNGSVKLAWDDDGVYLGFQVEDPDVIGGFKKTDKDPHLWTKDAVELMVDPDGDGDNKDYYEIQVGPQNLVFDSQFDNYNEPKKEPNGPFGHQEWSAKLKSAVSVDGTLDKAGDKDKGYTVEMMIPWKSFSKAQTTPPKVGDVWRLNFYAMKENNGVAWSPILGQGNFHKASRFGKVMWAEKGWVPPGLKAAVPPNVPHPGFQPLTAPKLDMGQTPKLRLPVTHTVRP